MLKLKFPIFLAASVLSASLLVGCSDDIEDPPTPTNPLSETATPESPDGPTPTDELATATATATESETATPSPTETATSVTDADGDGYPLSADCNDDDGTIHPGASEVCNGMDDDCDGLSDDADSSVSGAPTWYVDYDSDSYGSEALTLTQCAQPAGYVETNTDCNDTDAAYNPGASEEDCSDPNDYNCDGSTGFGDADNDGFAACEDCNDADDSIHPDAPEVCDGEDNNCDELVDDADPTVSDQNTYYSDVDLDGYGADSTAVLSCFASEGYVELGGDCDDDSADYNPAAIEEDCTDPNDYNCDGSVGYGDADGDGVAACEDCDDSNAEINPSAEEVCNGVDDDCDGLIDDADEAPTGTSTYYLDSDGDGYGDGEVTASTCSAPEGYVEDNTDCNDDDDSARPDTLWYADGDADGYGDSSSVMAACEQPEGYVVDRQDCNDGDAAINPNTIWYGDYDADGYGSDALTVVQCDTPDGFVASNDDCDDADAAFHPGATEDNCSDPNDYNCDGSVAFGDEDGDGYAACEDCDDANGAVHPGATEVCNDTDDDCDSLVDLDDDSLSDGQTAYEDSDGDGYGNPDASNQVCAFTSDYIERAGDCDDSNADVNPETTWYIDYDGDGFGTDTYTQEQCQQPSGFVQVLGDCNDTESTINPDGSEVCDGEDQDCDGVADEGPAEGELTFYNDGDGDGYGDVNVTALACEEPDGYTENSEDCDDGDSAINPEAEDICDGIDNDCDGEADAGALGGGATCAADDCLDILTALPDSVDGIYWIDPTVSEPFEVFCDMTNDGGGWTLVANIDDVDDLFFNAFNYEAWEEENVRNETEIATFESDINVSAKYQSFNTLIATDIRIAYKNDDKFFLCEGLDVNDTLPNIFSVIPSRGYCVSTCTTFSEDRLAEPSLNPAGLNCSDNNESWFDGATGAENARIGASSGTHVGYVFNGFLGAMGDRGYSSSSHERTWAAYSSGALWDDNVMLFVR